jgi:SagB-type dehydrogenase family enzyme
MANRDIAAARAYHEGTKHSPASLRREPQGLDWEIMPLPFKVYTDLEPISLSRDLHGSARPALAAIGGWPASTRLDPATKDAGVSFSPGASIDVDFLAHLLYFSAGIVKRRSSPIGDVYYRAAACTGNLHHIDLYLVCGELSGLAAGVYHFAPHDLALRRLRDGDHRATLRAATADEPSIAAAQAVLLFSSTLWRNAWKYRARAYRHCFWDSGTLLANLLAVTDARGVAAELVLGFVDDALRQLIDSDPEREIPLGLVALGGSHAEPEAPARLPPLAPLGHATLPLSAREIDYPQIRAMHAASALETDAEVRSWREAAQADAHGGSTRRSGSAGAVPSTNLVELAEANAIPAEPIEAVILRRGSTRHFARRPIALADLSTILRAVAAPIAADFAPAGELCCEVYAIAHAVDDLEPGSYFFDRARGGLELLRAGSFRREAAYLGLGQEIPGDASVLLFWLVDLEPVLARLGNRGYRAAQLEAAIGGGRAYLAAYALGLGASGLTFFDDDVTAFFAPHAAGKSVMFLIAIGRPRRPRHEPDGA